MATDFARARRRLKPERWTGLLSPRRRDELEWADDARLPGTTLLLDTCVYLDAMEGRLSPGTKALMRARTLRHVSIVLGELTHLFGRLRPTKENDTVFEALSQVVEAIDDRHVTAPKPGTHIEAGILCGLVFRLGGFQKGQEVAALNDAVIYMHALDQGQTVLTRNRADFDRMNQVVPAGRVLFYDPA